MGILRAFKGDVRTLPPDIYVNEMPVPQENVFSMDKFVLGFIGKFDRGPVNEFVFASETSSTKLVDIVSNVYGAASDSGAPGNQLLVHLDQAKATNAVFVRVLGAGHSTASITIIDRTVLQKPIIKISAKYPGAYANIFTVEVKDGSVPGTVTFVLTSDIGGRETYTDLNFNPLSQKFAINVINQSNHFEAELLNNGIDYENLDEIPRVLSATQLSGGSDGSNVTEDNYIGYVDEGLNVRSGLRLLETAGDYITDFAYIGFSSLKADRALSSVAEKYNSMCYCGTGSATTVSDAIDYRKTFDCDFMQMVYGNYYAVSGAKVDGACLSAIIHAGSDVQNSGLATECLWINGCDTTLDFDQLNQTYMNQIANFTLKPSEVGSGLLGYRISSDYTLAKTDITGDVISDNENRKVNKRRMNSWIENSLFFVAAKWQGRALTQSMKQAAEIRIRTFLENLKSPSNQLDDPKIEDYSVEFDDTAAQIDAFVQVLKIKHFNTAEWILLNYQGGTNVEIGGAR